MTQQTLCLKFIVIANYVFISLQALWIVAVRESCLKFFFTYLFDNPFTSFSAGKTVSKVFIRS